MNIALIDVDSHNFPNLALMKISAYHKAKGDHVEWWNGLKHYDVVYQSKVFDSTYTKDNEFCINADQIIRGGTGYGLNNHLPDEIENIYPDYSLYGITDTAYGFLTRGCPRGCKFCIVGKKEGLRSIKLADLSEFWTNQKEIKLLDPNLLACQDHENLLKQLSKSGAWVDFTQGLDIRLITKDNVSLLNKIKTKILHFAWDNPKDDLTDDFQRFNKFSKIKDSRKKGVYVLANFGSTHDQDLHRIYTLRDLGFDPYVMIYDKPHAPKRTRYLQRWVNNKIIFKTIDRFEDYDHRIG
ncbi:radical SAM protein [Anaerovorax sp. IOR16]|uniref:radical SAM protein n=1 Tax=Anaerovorax sp. IOR16 TaxID=2773458 RepID=UPI0019D10353|nr:radical SAM protein [Anaerovorax sp. IOR16]